MNVKLVHLCSNSQEKKIILAELSVSVFSPLKIIPKHFHNLLPFDIADGDDLLLVAVVVVATAVEDDINVLAAVACTDAVASVVLVVSSHFLFLIKSRFTLTLSHKCGHSIVPILMSSYVNVRKLRF